MISSFSAVLGLACVWACLVLSQAIQSAAPQEVSLRSFLQSFDHDHDTRYIAAFSDLDGDGVPEAIVYLISDDRCGTGGCETLILRRSGNTWKVVTEISISRPPIRVLNARSKGWRNISVWVQGGGIQPGYEAEMSFDGKGYPENPSVPPAHRLTKRTTGEIAIWPSMRAVRLRPEHKRSEPADGSRK